MKRNGKHIIIVVVIILITVLLERLAYQNYTQLTKQPVVVNSFIKIEPVYNTDGSWFHAKTGIGYRADLLLLENIVALLLGLYLFRFVEAYTSCFRMSMWAVYAVDVEIAVPLCRILIRLYSRYTLDYLYIRGWGTFDFPDICIGAGIAALFVWIVPALIKYYQLRKKKVQNLRFGQKLLWEFRIAGMMMKMPFVRKEKWEAEFVRWR